MANAGEVIVVFAADTAAFHEAIQKVRHRIVQLGNDSTKAAHGTIQPWMASSAAIRVLEGNITNNIRAAERFLAMIPGLRTALVTAFPVIGAVALSGVVAEMAERMVKFIDQSRKM